MAGYVGPIRLFGPLAAWAPLLVLAPVLHLGSHTAFGMGRCRLVWEDAMNDAASRSGR